MKTSHAAAAAAVIGMLGAFVPGVSSAQSQSTIPAVPTGWLSAHPTMAQTGTRPKLTWSITHPAIVQDYVKIIPPATIDPKSKLDMEVRVLGAGVTAHVTGSSTFTFVPTQAVLSFNGGGYQEIFYGTNLAVNPNKVVYSRSNVTAGQKIKFGGRYRYNNQWGTYFTSDSGTRNIRALVNGDTPPTVTPMHLAPTLEDFIRPYLDSNGKVKIGPMDVIIFMELTHNDNQMSDEGYDLQDMVLLVTFKSRSN